MRKQTKIAALVSAAALLAIGASMTSFAAAGWQVDPAINRWVYLDSDGNRVANEWKKFTDGRWCYLGEDGLVLTSQLVPYEDYLYAVDANGYRVIDAWWQEDNTNADEVNGAVPNTFWYRMAASTGRALIDTTATIDGQKFRFDSEGRVITGWYQDSDDSWYYYEDRVSENDHTYGAALNGWVQLAPRDGDEPTDQDVALVYYYFNANGQSQTGSVYYNKQWYYLDTNGQMKKSGWTEVTGNKAASNVGTASGAYMYADSEGAKMTGWQYVSDKELPGVTDATAADNWFYLKKNGVRFIPANKGQLASLEGSTSQVKVAVGLATINGKNYLFDDDGRMLSGLWKADTTIKSELGSSFTMVAGKTYLFSTDDHTDGGKCGWMIVNTKTTSSPDGIDTNYQFDSKGQRYENVIVNNVYYGKDGKRVDAYYDYDVIGETTALPTTYVLTKSGAVIDTAATPKVVSDAKILVNSKGVAQKNRKVSNVGGFQTFFIGSKMPSKTDVVDPSFKWADVIDTEWITDGENAAIKAETNYAQLSADKQALVRASGAIAEVKKQIADSKNKFSGYEIIATMN